MKELLKSTKKKILWKARRLRFPRPTFDLQGSKSTICSPIGIVGLFGTASGIGESARLCEEALRENGLETRIYDLSQAFQQADILSMRENKKTQIKNCKTIILHVNPPELERALFELNLSCLHSKRLIGYWAWELPSFPNGWESASKLISEIWVPSSFVKSSLSQKIVDRKITIVPHYVKSDHSPTKRMLETLTILAMADGRSSFTRKNVQGILDIFKTAFNGSHQAQLILKVRNLDQFPVTAGWLRQVCSNDSRITLISESLPEPELKSLIHSCDILLSPHRAEGFGLHLAEAMAAGKTVIATNWSGNLEFMNEKNSVLLPYELVPISDESGIYSSHSQHVWANPIIDQSAALLRQIADAPNIRMKLGERARIDIKAMLSKRNIIQALTRSQN